MFFNEYTMLHILEQKDIISYLFTINAYRFLNIFIIAKKLEMITSNKKYRFHTWYNKMKVDCFK